MEADVSSKVRIMTVDELKEIESAAFQRGVERGKFMSSNEHTQALLLSVHNVAWEAAWNSGRMECAIKIARGVDKVLRDGGVPLPRTQKRW